MCAWVFSDVHRDVGVPWRPRDVPDADLAIVAGDVGEGLVESVHWLAEHVLPHMSAVMVAGNHEFYRRVHPTALAQGRAAAAAAGVHLLEDDTVVINGIAVSGCTLWTDYALDGAALRARSMDDARRGLNDHRLITWGESPTWRRFGPEEALALHGTSRAFLRTALLGGRAPGGRPHVVVTHHGPSARSVAPRFVGKRLNPAFCSPLDDLIAETGPALWVHGHVHASSDYRIGATRVLCNPKGYGGENPDFDPMLVVEI